MDWKTIRLTGKQAGIIKKHARNEYGTEGEADGLRAILAVYFAERDIVFPIETAPRGRPRKRVR